MDVDEPSALSMFAETFKSLVGLLQESNEKYDVLAEKHRDLQRRYKRLEEELIHLKFSLLCEDCCMREGEICKQCSTKFDKIWKKC